MYKEKPWSLTTERNEEIISKPIKRKKVTQIDRVREIFEESPDKVFSCREIAELLSAMKSNVYVYIKLLYKSKIVKIVDFKKARNNSLIALYQSIQGKRKPLHIIPYNSEEYRKLNLISLTNFWPTDYKNYTKPFYEFRSFIESSSDITPFYVQGETSYTIQYRFEDLSKVWKSYSTPSDTKQNIGGETSTNELEQTISLLKSKVFELQAKVNLLEEKTNSNFNFQPVKAKRTFKLFGFKIKRCD